MKSTRVPGLVMAGVVGLAGLGIGAVIGPAGAVAATSSATQAVGDRLTAIKDALAGLVKDGTITQAQADKVATTLDQKLPPRGFRGHGLRIGAGLDEVASIIGIPKDINQATLVDKLVAAAKTRVAAEVKAGRLTQARADEVTKNLSARINEMVTHSWPMGMRGHHRGWGADGDGPDGGTPPSAPSSPSSSNTSSSSSSA
jgi:hypothetical protein